MKSIALVAFVALLSVQIISGLPLPDFGIAQNVTNSVKVVQQSGTLRDAFNALDNFSVTIKSGYPLLILVRDIFVSIASKLSNTGVALMDNLVTLANDRTGPVADAFGRVNGAITTLETLLNGGFKTELDTLTARLGPSLSNQLMDGFQGITSSLRALSDSLSSLQMAIEKTQQAAGNGPVTVQLVKKFVPTTLVYNVLAALESIGSALPTVAYTINKTVG